MSEYSDDTPVPRLRPDWRANLKDLLLVAAAGAAVVSAIAHVPSVTTQEAQAKAIAAIEMNIATMKSDQNGHNNLVDERLKTIKEALDRVELNGVPRKK